MVRISEDCASGEYIISFYIKITNNTISKYHRITELFTKTPLVELQALESMTDTQSVTIPEQLQALFATHLMNQDGRSQIEVPDELLETDTIDPTEVYQIAVIETRTTQTTGEQQRTVSTTGTEVSASPEDRQEPPVKTGELRTVTIDTLGKQGDGIARVEHGYVLIIEDVEPDEEVVVKIRNIQSNLAFATVVKRVE